MCLHYKQYTCIYKQYMYFQCTMQTHFCYCLFNVQLCQVYIFYIF
jgi:hypothetical protein